MTTYLITGASRGIGLELAREWLSAGHRVVATARNPEAAEGLQRLRRDHQQRLRLCAMDVASEASVAAAAGQLKDEKLDVLLNNAGTVLKPDRPLAALQTRTLAEYFNVNVFGPVRVSQAFFPHLKDSTRPVIAHISSVMGSIAECEQADLYGYRMTKAALNMFNKMLSCETHGRVICVVLHPGWVKTALGGPQAPLEPTESARGLVKVIGGLSLADTGRFIDYQGNPLPW